MKSKNKYKVCFILLVFSPERNTWRVKMSKKISKEAIFESSRFIVYERTYCFEKKIDKYFDLPKSSSIPKCDMNCSKISNGLWNWNVWLRKSSENPS